MNLAEPLGSYTMPKETRKRTSYTADFKLTVIKAAKETSNRDAAKKFGVNECNVRRWKKDKSLEFSSRDKRANRGPKHGHYPEMEKELFKWIEIQRQSGYGVSRIGVHLEALRIAQTKKYKGFTASEGWCTRFLHRHSISLRQKTDIAQQILPSEYEYKLLSFQKFVIDQRKAVDYPLSKIGNMDEISICFEMPSSIPLNENDEKPVMLKTSKFTVVLACTADGGKLPPMVIFSKSNPPQDVFPSVVIIHNHPKGVMDEEGVKKWLDQVWVMRDGGLLKEPSLLVWDRCKAHQTEGVKKKLAEENISYAVIPRGLTSVLQPLDVSISKAFRANIRNLWSLWMEEGRAEMAARGWFEGPSLPTVVSWVKSAWDEIPAEMIEMAFLKCCISMKLEGTDDDYLWQDVTQETAPGSEDDAETQETASSDSEDDAEIQETASSDSEDDAEVPDDADSVLGKNYNESKVENDFQSF